MEMHKYSVKSWDASRGGMHGLIYKQFLLAFLTAFKMQLI